MDEPGLEGTTYEAEASFPEPELMMEVDSELPEPDPDVLVGSH